MKWSPLAVAVTAALNLQICQTMPARAEIRSVEIGQPVPLANNAGDTWVSAWAKNGAVYTPSDDTDGFRKIGPGNLAFNRIDGEDPLKLSGVTINPMGDYGAGAEELSDGCTWKSSGCYAVDDVLYWP